MQIQNKTTKEILIATNTQLMDEYLFVKLSNGEMVTFKMGKSGFENDKYQVYVPEHKA